MIVNKIANRLKTNSENTFRFIRHALSRNGDCDQRLNGTLLLNIPEPKLERYYFLLAKFFEIAGWKVCIKFSPNLLLNLRNFSDLIYSIPSLDIVLQRPKKLDLELSLDNTDYKLNRLQIDVNYFSTEKETDSYILPYQMHPEIYDSGISEIVGDMREGSRTIRVLFAGNSGDTYSNPDIEEIFGKINRNRLTDILKCMIDGSKVLWIESKHAFMEESRTKKDSLFFLSKDVRLEIDEWMGALANADFYVAAPGVSMPFSHNAVEAMAVGTIPIIEYGEMFVPELRDGVNCMTFSGEDDFKRRIHDCISMSDNEILRLRTGVIEYYEQYLAPKSVVGNLCRKAGKVSKLYVNCEHLSALVLKERMR